MNEKKETADAPRGRVQVLPKSMSSNPRAWLQGLDYVASVEEAAKERKPFGVRGVMLAEAIIGAGHEFLQKTMVQEESGYVSHYQFAPKGASK